MDLEEKSAGLVVEQVSARRLCIPYQARSFWSMNTPTLVPCPKCRHSISSYAKRCPKCRTNVFKCVICEKHGNYDDYQPGAGPLTYHASGSKYYHLSCLAPYFVFPDTVRCPGCQQSLKNSGIDAFHELSSANILGCPYCGYPNPLPHAAPYDCKGCNSPILSFQRYIHIKDQYGDDRYYHDFCAQIREALIRSGWPE